MGALLEDSSWENVVHFKVAYPTINLEDKVFSEGVDNDTRLESPIVTFTREDFTTFIRGFPDNRELEERLGMEDAREPKSTRSRLSSRRTTFVPTWTEDFDLSEPRV